MKRGTPEHPKMLDLAEMVHSYLAGLGVEIPFEAAHAMTCGFVERLLHYTARYAIDGGIGKHSDARVARAIGWTWDAAWFMEALVATGFADKIDTCRIYLHDWHEHADDGTQIAMARKVAVFANGHLPRMTRLSKKTERNPILKQYKEKYGEDCLKNNRVNLVATESTQKAHGVATESTPPSQGQGHSQGHSEAKALAGPRPIENQNTISPSPLENSIAECKFKTPPEPEPFDLSEIDWDRAELDARKIADRVRPQNQSHVKFFVRLAAACQSGLSEGFIPDALAALKANQSQAGPQAHFTSIAKSKATEEFQIPDLFAFLKRYRKIDNSVVAAIKTAYGVT